MTRHISIDLSRFDAAQTKLTQLSAILACASGPSFDSFSSLDRKTQGHFMWLARDLARDALEELLSE